MKPIRPGEAPSTCTAGPLGESPSDKMRDHHHYHYLFAKQRPTLGPILIGFTNYNEHLVFGAQRMLEEEGRVNAWIKASIRLKTSAVDRLAYTKINAFYQLCRPIMGFQTIIDEICAVTSSLVCCVKMSCQTDLLKSILPVQVNSSDDQVVQDQSMRSIAF